MITYMIISAAVAALVAVILTALVCNSKADRKLNECLKEQETEMARLRTGLARKESELEMASKYHEKAIAEMKENTQRQMQTLLADMKSETAEILRQREEELAKGNRSEMDGILKPLKESMDAMRKAMKENEESHIRNTVSLSKQLEQAVKDMEQKTADIGAKADNLSEALTSRPKVQGCFGENFLDAMLANENLVEGLHYTREAANDDLSRPDFVFHFKDGLEQKDLIVDSKVSLTAFVEYVNAKDEQARTTALADHLRSVRKHVDELAAKDYARKNPNSFADYVVMFMPISAALQAALDQDPMLWQDSYRKGVLITTEQTIMPFLKIIQLTWTKYRHDTNLLEITKAAETMIERVGSFYDSYRELGKKLKAVCREYNDGVGKLKDNGFSITTSARKVMAVGIRRAKGKELSAPSEQLPENEIEA
ncbi:MAG: DNA recombination protein RmuC [Candidatus Cryptobacteroides sp.]